MKHSLLSILILVSFSFPSFADKVLKGAEANEAVKGAEVVRLKDFSNIPAHIQFRQGERIAFSSWQDWMTQRYFKDVPQVGFQLLREEQDKLGMSHYRYQQTAHGIPVTFGVWIVHTLNGEVVSMNGELFDSFEQYSPGLTEAQALQHALNAIDADIYKWEVPLEEEAIKMIEGDLDATYYPSGKLEVINSDPTLSEVDLHLAWKFNVYAHEPMSRRDIYIDAQSGSVLFENDLIHHADSNGTAQTGYSGLQNIVTDFTGSQFRLRESGRGDGILTFNMNGATSGTGSDFFHSDNVWDTTIVQRFGTDAHWGAEMTYDFFFNHFNRNSIDDDGFALRSRVHYGNNYANAFWDGTQMTYGDGSSGNSPFTALDIAGHEISHGLTTFTAGLIYQNESGALNESFSDIFGAAVEFDALGFANGDWTMGEDLGFVIRYMSNPNLGGDPDTYEGDYWYVGTNDNGGVHTNSGVQNFWFYLLVEGGSGTNDNNDSYNVTALGLADAAAIAYRNLVVYLTPSSQYEDARYYAIQSAVDLYGPCSQQTESTWEAWYAVGIGDAYTGEVIADFSANMTENCLVPTTIEFTNLSVLGQNYLWDFGDGNTSTAMNPSHTYALAGEYTVTLITSSSCGSDTLVMDDYIKLGPSYPCQVILPSAGGLAPTQTSCEGYVYDDGGANGDYSPNHNSTLTIAPVGAVSVSLEFLMFNVENDPGCIYDNLIVYDGSNTGAPVIGTYCDGNPPPAVITSTGPSITMQFHTDEALEEAGFEIFWQCNIPTETPIADFEADRVETCLGEVNFTDLSSVGANVATGWYWDFGDGNTDTVQHPTHVYATDGTYDVTMVAINPIGTDTMVKSNYIAVDRPDAPTGDDDDICPGEQGVLIANSAGEHFWYDSPSGGSLLHVGDTFTTPIVQQSTAFYVESLVEGTPVSTGAPNNQIGSGNNFNFLQSIYFDVFSDFRLKSVTVYASIPGDREIVVYDQNGNIVHDTITDIDAGEQVVTLDWNFSPGVDYSMTLSSSSMIQLFRNNGGVNYPYEIPNVVSITRSSANTDPYGYYYFFYNWQVAELCLSERTSIAASTGICTGIDEEAVQAFNVFPNPSNGEVTVTWNSTLQPTSLQLYNSAGMLVSDVPVRASEGSSNLDLSHLDAGIYLLRSKDARIEQRIIIQ